jgi:glycosyltransferase involved in cell wall biosynthesis
VTSAVTASASGHRLLGRLNIIGVVILMLPARNEAPRIAAVLERVPAGVEVVVVDDGSTDRTGDVALAHGATVVRTSGLGLGAAVRIGLREAVRLGADVVAFCDADGEYDPAEIHALSDPILRGEADYVVGSRFAGTIESMRPHRRFGNRTLTTALRALTGAPITDGQSGYRALSAAAASSAEISHDFNYAQVLTIELLRKGFRYAEVPITYSFRSSGESFVKLLPYLRRVVPAVAREWAAWRTPSLARRWPLATTPADHATTSARFDGSGSPVPASRSTLPAAPDSRPRR